jgi:hypothetical protein
MSSLINVAVRRARARDRGGMAVDLTGDGGVMKQLLNPGSGEGPKSGYRITCHYVATLVDGTQFDSSRARGQPYEFELGGGKTMKVRESFVAGGVRWQRVFVIGVVKLSIALCRFDDWACRDGISV